MSLQWFLFITAVVIILQGWIYKRWGFSGIIYTRSFSTRGVFEGEEAEMVERILNQKLLPLPWLRIESKMNPNLEFYQQSDLRIKHGEFHRSIFSLMPYTGITRRHRVKCLKRGCYRLTSAAMTLGDLFGTYDESKDFTVNAEILVFPRLVPVNEIPLPSHSWQGDITVKRWILEDPFMISGVRDYQWGDPLNRISWKASARTGELKVYNRDFTADPRLMILLNIDQSEAMWDAVTNMDLVERGISYAISLAQHAISNGIPVGFGCNAYQIDQKDRPIRIGPSMSKEHLYFLLEVMAKLIIVRSMTFFTFLEEELSRQTSALDYLFITPYTSDRMNQQISRLRSRGNSVEILLLDKESENREAAV
jgi:uncharacterized protein (DUF58 family)